MNILTQQIDGSGNVTLLSLDDINNIQSNMNLGDWLSQSVSVTESGNANIYKITDTITLDGGVDFRLDNTRANPELDNWTMTASGIVLRVTITATNPNQATITQAYRHPWVFSADNNMDYFRRSFRLFSTGDVVKPVSITSKTVTTNLLAEDSFPEITMNIRVYAARHCFLRNFSLKGTPFNSIQYSVNGGGWSMYGGSIQLAPGTISWDYLDGVDVEVKIRFVQGETEMHRFRDQRIHGYAGHIQSAHDHFSSKINITGRCDVIDTTNGDVTQVDLFAEPFTTQIPESLNVESIRVDTVKVRHIDQNGDSPGTLDNMARVFENLNFNGNWLTIDPSCFTQPGGLRTSIKDVNDTLPASGWVVLDNGSLLNIDDGKIVNSYMSSLKWNGSVRFTQMLNNPASISVSGDRVIQDTDTDKTNFPVNINNALNLRIISNGPLTNMTISNGDDNDSVPQATMSLFRKQWDTIYGGEMMIGEFYTYENDKEELERVKKKTYHDYTVLIRKIPGYQYDLNYPVERQRLYTLDLNTSTNVYTAGSGVSSEPSTHKIDINIRRDSTRWGKYELPRVSTQDTTWTSDAGFAQHLAKRVYVSDYHDLDEWLHQNTEVENDFGDNPGDNGFDIFNNNRTTLETATGPYNTPNVKIFKSISETSRTAGNGGFTRNDGTGWDTSHDYVTIVYVMREGPDSNSGNNGGNYYHGCGWWTGADEVRNLNGNINSNPYFGITNLNAMTRGEWYVSIGFLRNINGTSTTNWGGGLWNLNTGKKLRSYIDFRIGSDGRRRHRCFQFYCPTDTRELHQCGFMDFDMTDRGWSYQQVLDMFIPKNSDHYMDISASVEGFRNRKISAITYSDPNNTRTHQDLSGAWQVEGSLDQKQPLDIDGVDYTYTQGVLVESKLKGADTNNIIIQQSGNALTLPKATLDGGFDGSDKLVISGGQPGPAIRCRDAVTTINNNGTIIGDIERV